MKPSSRITISSRLSIVVLLLGVTTQHAQTVTPKSISKSSQLRLVRVYFPVEPPTSGPELKPLQRCVDAKSPLGPAIEALIAGPTSTEAKQGYVGVAYGGLKLTSIKLERGVALVDFARTIRSDYNPGDLETLRFQGAVVKTARQFPSVKKVIVCVNGLNEFGIGLVIDEAVPCPNENQRAPGNPGLSPPVQLAKARTGH